MTAYRRGADFERRVKAKLEDEGWTVFRTAGSHSPADLICLRAAECWTETRPTFRTRLIQCKSGKTSMTKTERLKFREFAQNLGADAWVALRGMQIEPA